MDLCNVEMITQDIGGPRPREPAINMFPGFDELRCWQQTYDELLDHNLLQF